MTTPQPTTRVAGELSISPPLPRGLFPVGHGWNGADQVTNQTFARTLRSLDGDTLLSGASVDNHIPTDTFITQIQQIVAIAIEHGSSVHGSFVAHPTNGAVWRVLVADDLVSVETQVTLWPSDVRAHIDVANWETGGTIDAVNSLIRVLDRALDGQTPDEPEVEFAV